MACWDMRFQLPISSHYHPSRARIRRLSMHPLYQSWVIAGKMAFVMGVLGNCTVPYCYLRVLILYMNQRLDCILCSLLEVPTTGASLSSCIYCVQHMLLCCCCCPPFLSTTVPHFTSLLSPVFSVLSKLLPSS